MPSPPNLEGRLFAASLAVLALSCLLASSGMAEGRIRQVTVYGGPTYDAFPSLTRISGGDLLAAFRIGSGHVGADGRLALARSSDNGLTWSVTELYDDPNLDDRVRLGLTELRDGTLLLPIFKSTSDSFVRSLLMTSSDHGRSWSEPQRLNRAARVSTNTRVYGRVLERSNGDLLMAGYRPITPTPPELFVSEAVVLGSRDGGRSWDEWSTIAPGIDINETTIVALSGRHLLAVARVDTYSPPEHLYQARSRDGGRTWGPAKRLFPNSTGSSLVSPDLIELRSERLLLCAADRGADTGIVCHISSDRGRTWSGGTQIYEAQQGDLGYPSSVELPNRRIVTAFYDNSSDIVVRLFREDLLVSSGWRR